MIDAPLAYAFGVGMVATVNPCGFAMLPAYLSFFLGLEGADADTRASVRQALVIGSTMTAGFLVVFGILGIVLDSALSSVQQYLPWVTMVLGIGLVAMGIALLRGRSISLRLPTISGSGSTRQLTSVFLFGVSYTFVSLSCTIPLFIAAVAPSFTDANFASGVAAFLAYGLGMGVVLVALTVALALARHSLVRSLRRVLPYVYRVSGALLVAVGVYVAYYGWYELRTRSGDTSGGGPAQVVFDLNAASAAGSNTPARCASGSSWPPRSVSSWPSSPAGIGQPEPMFDELLAHPGVREVSELRSRFGFMAFHGGNLETGTDEIVAGRRRASGASYYAIIQPPDLRWHLPSTGIDPVRSGPGAFLDHVDRGGHGARLRASRPVHDAPARRATGSWPRTSAVTCGRPARLRRPRRPRRRSRASCAACTRRTRSTGPGRGRPARTAAPGPGAGALLGRRADDRGAVAGSPHRGADRLAGGGRPVVVPGAAG